MHQNKCVIQVKHELWFSYSYVFITHTVYGAEKDVPGSIRDKQINKQNNKGMYTEACNVRSKCEIYHFVSQDCHCSIQCFEYIHPVIITIIGVIISFFDIYMHADATTGARMLTHFPKLLKNENSSKRLVAPTVILCMEINDKF